MGDTWASDTPVSRPEPLSVKTPSLVDFEGFGFSVNGMVHDINEPDLEAMMTPTFAPEGYMGILRDSLLPVDRHDRERQ